MLASFTNGPLDGTEREIDIAFALIEIFWVKGMDPETVPLFQVAIGTEEIWQYSLETTDYESRATYWGSKIGGNHSVWAEPYVWTAAGDHFDVMSEYDDEPVEVEVLGDQINFPGLGIVVRLAQRQGE